MLRVVDFSSPFHSPPCLTNTPHRITFSPLLPNKFCRTNIILLSIRFPHKSFFRRRTGLSVSDSKKRGSTSISHLDVDEFDDDEEDEDEMLVPFGQMKRWIENKPPGFGEGKQYDTSIEDKLLEELEQSIQAQLSNVKKLKNDSPKPSSKKLQQLEQAPEVIPGKVRVRVENLPKKKNIHRDLKLAFKGFPGIVNISPAVSGNEKTRDPVCKGFAFVDLNSEADANRFVQMYNRQGIHFAKVQKQIKCEITNPLTHNYTSEESAGGHCMSAQLTVCGTEEDPDADSDADEPSTDMWDENLSGGTGDTDNQNISDDGEEIIESAEFVNMTEPNDTKTRRTVTKNGSLPLKQRKKNSSTQKKQVVKRKSDDGPKLNIPGSANRLKIKEKALLTGVFSKYGRKASLANHEES